jgi:hypothetical protein
VRDSNWCTTPTRIFRRVTRGSLIYQGDLYDTVSISASFLVRLGLERAVVANSYIARNLLAERKQKINFAVEQCGQNSAPGSGFDLALPRCSALCMQWRCVMSDPTFLSRRWPAKGPNPPSSGSSSNATATASACSGTLQALSPPHPGAGREGERPPAAARLLVLTCSLNKKYYIYSNYTGRKHIAQKIFWKK